MSRIGFCAEIRQVTCDGCSLRGITTATWRGAAQPGVSPHDMARGISSALDTALDRARGWQEIGGVPDSLEEDPQVGIQKRVTNTMLDELRTAELAIGGGAEGDEWFRLGGQEDKIVPAATNVEQALGSCVARRIAGDCTVFPEG